MSITIYESIDSLSRAAQSALFGEYMVAVFEVMTSNNMSFHEAIDYSDLIVNALSKYEVGTANRIDDWAYNLIDGFNL